MRILQTLFLFMIEISLFSQITRPDTTAQIFDLYDIRQNIRSDFTFITTPLLRNYIGKLYDIEDFVICCYDYHMDIFDKRNEYWQVYTISDGFKPIKKIISGQNYGDYFALIGLSIGESDLDTVVNIFNKKNLNLPDLSLKDYYIFKENENKIDYIDTEYLWAIEDFYPFKVVCQDLNSGQKTYYSFTKKNLNYYPELYYKNDMIFGVNESGIVLHEKESNKNQSNTLKSFYSGNLNSVAFYKNISICHDSVVDVVNYDNPKIIKSINLKQNVDHAIFEEGDIYFSNKNVFFFKKIGNDSLIFKTELNNNIINIYKIDSSVFLVTKNGISIFDANTKNIQHILGNSAFKQIEYEEESNYSTIKVLGELEGGMVVLKKDWDYTNAFIKAEILKCSYKKEYLDTLIVSSDIKNRLVKSSFIKIENKQLIISDNRKIDIFEIVDTKVFAVKNIFSYLIPDDSDNNIPNAFVPKIDFPIGDKVLDLTMGKNAVWLSTNKGIFSYDKEDRNWTSFFLGAAYVYNGVGLIVTNKAIYCSGYTFNNQAWPWTRIDRKSYKIERFGQGAKLNAYANSFKKDNDEIIFLTPEGLNVYNFNKNTYKSFSTDSPIGQVSFLDNNYLVSNSKEIKLIKKDGSVSPIYTFSDDLAESHYKKAPELMEINQGTVWLSSYFHSAPRLLTKIDLSIDTRIDYFVKDEIVKILPDGLNTWIITRSSIYRYNNANNGLYELGAIKCQGFRNNQMTEYIHDAVIQGNVIYITGIQGIYSFNCNSHELLIYNQQFYMNFCPSSIDVDGNFLYVSTGPGIFQFDMNYFNYNLELNPNFKFSNEIESNFIYPLKLQDTILFPADNDNALLFFNISKAFEDKIVDKIVLNQSLKVYINSKELNIIQGCGSTDGVENIYYVRLNKHDIKRPYNSLKILIRDSDNILTLFKEWTIIGRNP